MSTTTPLLRRIEPGNVRRYVRDTLDPNAVQDAQAIINDVRSGGIEAVRSQAERFGELKAGQQLVLNRDQLQQAIELIDSDSLELLQRVSQRIERFASAQRDSIRELSLPIPGGEAGHSVLPVDTAGCYAPAGRHPLPSSVLMTAMTARVAGCKRVVVASPSRDPVMLAAAAIAGADEYLAVGGAHAIAALAFGFEGFASCDIIVGPGNKWVTAAKHLVSDRVGIDMLAGPSELLILADETANPSVVAADLLAQAEHDDDAVPMLVTTSTELPNLVEQALSQQLETLPTALTARRALQNGFACVVESRDAACQLSDQIAAEHVEILMREPDEIASQLRNAGGIFIGPASAEVLGDYGSGPNHTLPTGGSARYAAGLSVMHFLRLRTWLRIESALDAKPTLQDAAALARIEGLEAHRASALSRVVPE
jgi:phosphoribosyl-ATP pyrophosphohydrolase/phosphoribosyl-AMP cyclohydrolase/histidinol dehydrogenase